MLLVIIKFLSNEIVMKHSNSNKISVTIMIINEAKKSRHTSDPTYYRNLVDKKIVE